jgi:hypothetical protein
MAKGWGWAKHINSHEKFVHDSIDSLGYDWSRVADPAIEPQYPLRIYLPRTTNDVVEIINEVNGLGLPLTVRAHGHSSNDLVVRDRGTVLLTEKMNKVLDIDAAGLTATVQPGCQSADIDDILADKGLGLLVIGDHAHVTVGGFASVGGISASSFRFGLFVDTVERLEYVTWSGEVLRCSRTERADDFNRVLLGLGRYGVITALTLRIERVDKYQRIWQNNQVHLRSMDTFVKHAVAMIRQPPSDARFMRGMWVDAGKFGIGQWSVYVDTPATQVKRLENDASYAVLDGIGYVAGRLPTKIDQAVKYLGLIGILFPPRYAFQKNAESFSDRIIDSTVGDPTRYLVAIARQSNLDEVCRRLMAVLVRYRKERNCFSVLTMYLKGIRSPHLAGPQPDDDRWAEVLFYVAMRAENMTDALLEQIVDEFDQTCVELGAYRYMHSKTSKDPIRKKLLDPHSRFEAGEPLEASEASPEVAPGA